MEKLRLLRKEAGLTMKQLGTDLGMAESTVSLYETGKRNPDVQTLIRFADYFDVSLDYLCGRVVENTNKDDLYREYARLLGMLNQLNDEGLEKVFDYADDLAQSGKYKKDSSSGMVQKSI